MKIFIPQLGTRFTLNSPWTFNLHDESRNEKFWLKLHGKVGGVKTNFYKGRYSNYKPALPIETTLPKGTVLEVDRIFIRAGADGFDSVTFKTVKTKGIDVPVGRFWAKLEEINNILDVEVGGVADPYPLGRFSIQIGKGQYYNFYGIKEYCTCGFYDKWQNRQSDWTDGGCKCDQSKWPHWTINRLVWLKNPHNRFSVSGVAVSHKTDTNGINLITVEKHAYRSSRDDYPYTKDFGSFDALIEWAKKKEFHQDHIDIFIKQYEKKTVLTKENIVV